MKPEVVKLKDIMNFQIFTANLHAPHVLCYPEENTEADIEDMYWRLTTTYIHNLKEQCNDNAMALILQAVKLFYYQLWPVVMQLSIKH